MTKKIEETNSKKIGINSKDEKEKIIKKDSVDLTENFTNQSQQTNSNFSKFFCLIYYIVKKLKN